MHTSSLTEALENKEKVTSLYLYQKRLKKFPIEILECKNLESLNLSYNPIKEVPKEIGGLKKLQHLDLHSCKLSEIPKEIGKLTNLITLQIGYNQLTSIPQEIGNLHHLRDLHIDDNQLTEIPKEIGNLTNLWLFSATKNQLTELPNIFEKLTKLEILSLYYNQITHLPPSFEYLTNCKTISLFNNQLTEIPMVLKNSPLEELSLNDNQITEITDDIKHFSSVTKIGLARNPLHSISPEIKHLKNLKFLETYDTNLTELPDVFDHFKELEEVWLSDNPLKKLPNTIYNHETLKELWFNGSNFEKFPLEALFIPNLKTLRPNKGLYPSLILEKRKAFSTACNKKNLSIEFKQLFYDMVSQKEENSNKFSLENYFQALGINFLPLQEKALNFIRENWENKLKDQPIQKGKSLTILGKSSFNKKEVKERLQKLEIDYTSKITTKTTHVILEKGVNKYDNFDKEGLVFIPESALQNFLDTADTLYLSEESTAPEDIENIQLLLSTLEEDTLLMGLEMLHSLGGAEKVITELFLIVKNTNLSTKVRNKAKKHFLLQASENLKNNISKHKSVTILPSIKKKFYFTDSDLVSNILKFTHNTELDKVKVYSFLFDHQYIKSTMLCSCMLRLNTEEQQLTLMKKYLNDENKFQVNNYFDITDYPNSIKAKKQKIS